MMKPGVIKTQSSNFTFLSIRWDALESQGHRKEQQPLLHIQGLRVQREAEIHLPYIRVLLVVTTSQQAVGESSSSGPRKSFIRQDGHHGQHGKVLKGKRFQCPSVSPHFSRIGKMRALSHSLEGRVRPFVPGNREGGSLFYAFKDRLIPRDPVYM